MRLSVWKWLFYCAEPPVFQVTHFEWFCLNCVCFQSCPLQVSRLLTWWNTRWSVLQAGRSLGKGDACSADFWWGHCEQTIVALRSALCLCESVQWTHLHCHLGDQEGLGSYRRLPPAQKLFSSIPCYGICRSLCNSPGDFSDIKKNKEKNCCRVTFY